MASAATASWPMSHGARCSSCPLRGKTPVPPTSPRTVRFVIVGEGPGRLEERRGAPFIGPSGGLLDKHLRESGLQRREAHVTNAILCRLEDEALPEVKLAALSCCAPRLALELNDLRRWGDDRDAPILALGGPALRSVLGVNGIQKARGFVWETPDIEEKRIEAARKALAKMRAGARSQRSRDRVLKKQQALWLLEARQRIAGRTVIPTVHPAFILRGADGWLPVMATDMRRFKRVLDGTVELEDEAPYDVASTPAKIRTLIAKLEGAIAVDVETSGPSPLRDRLLCVGLSDGTRTVVVYPWKKTLAPALKGALSGRTLVTHYGPQFDQIVLRREGVLP